MNKQRLQIKLWVLASFFLWNLLRGNKRFKVVDTNFLKIKHVCYTICRMNSLTNNASFFTSVTKIRNQPTGLLWRMTGTIRWIDQHKVEIDNRIKEVLNKISPTVTYKINNYGTICTIKIFSTLFCFLFI